VEHISIHIYEKNLNSNEVKYVYIYALTADRSSGHYEIKLNNL